MEKLSQWLSRASYLFYPFLSIVLIRCQCKQDVRSEWECDKWMLEECKRDVYIQKSSSGQEISSEAAKYFDIYS